MTVADELPSVQCRQRKLKVGFYLSHTYGSLPTLMSTVLWGISLPALYLERSAVSFWPQRRRKCDHRATHGQSDLTLDAPITLTCSSITTVVLELRGRPTGQTRSKARCSSLCKGRRHFPVECFIRGSSRSNRGFSRQVLSLVSIQKSKLADC